MCVGCSDDNEARNKKNNDINTVLVFSSSEARQCEHAGLTDDESAQKLIDVGIDVISSSCGNLTGVAYPSVCGGGTSAIIIHEIPEKSILDSENIGFSSVESIDNNYTEADCN